MFCLAPIASLLSLSWVHCHPRSAPHRGVLSKWDTRGERERNVLFNDALNTFYLRLYGVRHMVKDHSDSCRHIGYSFRLAARVLLCAPSHRQDSNIPRPLLHQSWSTGWNDTRGSHTGTGLVNRVGVTVPRVHSLSMLPSQPVPCEQGHCRKERRL